MYEVDDEIRQLEAMKNQYANKIDEYTEMSDSIQEKIERLEKAYKEIAGVKSKAKELYGYSYDGILYQGNPKNWISTVSINYGEDASSKDMYQEFWDYITEIDSMQDEINSKISDLKQKDTECWDVIGNAQNLYHEATAKIENFFN